MSETINRTVVVTAANAPLARTLAAALSAGGVGMFESPLPNEANPTHFISSGQIDSAFDVVLKDANALFQASNGLATLVQCQNLIETSIVVDCDIESASETCARLGLL